MNVVPPSRWQDRTVIVGAMLAPLAVSAVLVPFRRSFPNTDGALLLVAVIVAVAAFGRRAAGLLAAVSSAVWFDFFLTAPYQHFTITRRADVETTILLLLVGAAVTELAVRGRRHRVRAEIESRYLAALGSVSAPVTTRRSAPDVTREAAARLTEMLNLRGSRFEYSSFGGMPRLEGDGRVRAGDSYLDVDVSGWPSSPVELLAQTNGRTAGRFVLDPRPGETVPLEALQVASMLAGQVAAAIADQPSPRR